MNFFKINFFHLLSLLCSVQRVGFASCFIDNWPWIWIRPAKISGIILKISILFIQAKQDVNWPVPQQCGPVWYLRRLRIQLEQLKVAFVWQFVHEDKQLTPNVWKASQEERIEWEHFGRGGTLGHPFTALVQSRRTTVRWLRSWKDTGETSP